MRCRKMSNAYLVDVGVVVDKDEYPTCYSKVYDEARGYYKSRPGKPPRFN